MRFYKPLFKEKRDGGFYPDRIFQFEIYFKNGIEIDNRFRVNMQFSRDPFDIIIEAESDFYQSVRFENFCDNRFAQPVAGLENVSAVRCRELQNMRPCRLLPFYECRSRFSIESDEGMPSKRIERGACFGWRGDQANVFKIEPAKRGHGPVGVSGW